ncbi:glycosyltransferase [Propionicimonas sp.]|uniref:glycosyltransferase n=1 Tax=Propionicimonas sp. TaxID=1955623 RepID=UPI0039E62B3B
MVYSPGYNALARADCQILTIHDLIHLQTSWPGRAKYLSYYNGPVRRAIRRAGVVLTVSETSRQAIEAWMNDNSVRVVNAGIGSSDAFHPDGRVEASAGPYFVYVGNLRAHKNFDTLLRALPMTDGFRLKAVVPAGEILPAQRLVNQAGLARRVDLLHSLDDERIAACYRGATATFMPSLLEGFGLPALESVQCGTPVIFWSGCQAVAETVQERGWRVREGRDPEEWATVAQDALQAQLRVTPPAASAYDWNITAAKISGVLEGVLTGGR